MATPKVLTKTSIIRLNEAVTRVFPLFGPLREQEWAEGWQPRMVIPDSEEVQEHMVFQTESHDLHNPSTSTWIVSKYDPKRAFIEYTVFTDARIWWVAISCEEDEARSTTAATVTYTYLGLTQQANHLNEVALESMFRHDLRDWEKALNYYLKTGTQLSHSHHFPSEPQ